MTLNAFEMNKVEYYLKKVMEFSVLYLSSSFSVPLLCSHSPFLEFCDCFHTQVGSFPSTREQITSYYWSIGAILWFGNGLIPDGFDFSCIKLSPLGNFNHCFQSLPTA